MSDDRVAAMLAGQTAMISVICESLISKGLLDRGDLCDSLYALLEKRKEFNADPNSEAAVRHLLSLIEQQ